MYQTYIQEQLESFLSFDEVPQSIAIFNISELEAKDLYSSLQPTFDKIKAKAKEKIEKEFEEKEKLYDEMLNESLRKRQEVQNKYRTLEYKYRDRPELKSEFMDWQTDELFTHTKETERINNIINNIPEETIQLTNDYDLVDFDVQQYYEVRQQMRKLEQTYELEQRHERRKALKTNLGLDLPETKEEIEHTKLHKYEVKRYFAKFAIAYNIQKKNKEGMSLDYLMEHLLCKEKVLSTMVWCVFCFESNNKWYSQAPEELKEFINNKCKIFSI